MRELKFRAWDTQLETYTYSGWGEKTFSIFVKRTNCKRYIIEQYTGSKDKNGVEIYESDICKWEIPCTFAGTFSDDGEVIPDFTTGRGVIKYREYGFFTFSDDEQCNILTNDQIDFVEIIGNIHQKESTS